MRPSLATIATAVHRATKFDPRRQSRLWEYVRVRWLAWWVAEQYGYSLPRIGRYFGLHHTTVLSGLRKIHEELVAGEFLGESRRVMKELQQKRAA